MKIAVLQQIPPHAYGDSRAMDLSALKDISKRSVLRCLELIDEAAEKGADLAVTTETVNAYLSLGDTRFTYDETLEGESVRLFSEAAKKHKMHLAVGLALNIDGKPYNCAVLFGENGEIIGVHKKVHLPAGEELHFNNGDRFEVFETKFGNVGMLVCWDLQFPEAARELALGGADLICCPTYGWENIYGLSRAYENSVYIAAGMCTYPGGKSESELSSIVDNMGNLLVTVPDGKEGVGIAEVDIRKEPNPQYGSQQFYPSHSMRKTRFSQRRTETYKLINEPLEKTPLYKRYFGK